MRKVLILGINGFTGKHFQEYIIANRLRDAFSFVGVDKTIDRPCFIKCKKMDLLSFNNLEKLILDESPDYILNLIGTFNTREPHIIDINAGISRNIFEILIKHKRTVEKILLIGSAAEYGLYNRLPIKENTPLNPITIHGLSKVIQTTYANFYFRNYNLHMNIARTFNVIGRSISPLLSLGSFVSQIRKIKNTGIVYVGNLNSGRDFLDIKDVLSAYWKILLKGKSGEVYNVCSGSSHSIKDILKFLIARSHKKIRIVTRKDYVRKPDLLDSFGDNIKLRKDVGWRQENDIWSALSEML